MRSIPNSVACNRLKIVVVGGGTAGWLTAAFLQNQLPHTINRPVDITVVEAEDIPTVGEIGRASCRERV